MVFNSKTFVNNCKHNLYFDGEIKFCKSCGMFLPLTKNIILRNNESKIKINKINPYYQFKKMLSNQITNRCYNEFSSHLNYRPKLINWIKHFCEKLKYSNDTFYLSSSYLDLILSFFNLQESEIKLVCFLCIIIAAKYKEKEIMIPKFKDIIIFFKNEYSINEIYKYEKLIFKCLDWNLNLITPFEFIKFFLKVGILNQKEIKELYTKNNLNYSILEFSQKILNKFEEILNYFIEISLNIYDLYQFTPLAISASCIALTKKILGLNNIWNSDLEELTFLKWNQIKNISNLISQYIEKNQINLEIRKFKYEIKEKVLIKKIKKVKDRKNRENIEVTEFKL